MLAQRDLARLMVITRRPREVPAFREMHGELAGDLPGALAVPLLQSLTRPQVEPYPVPEGDARIEHALVQGMNEGIAAGHCAVGPFGHPGRTQKLPSPRQVRTAPFPFPDTDTVR